MDFGKEFKKYATKHQGINSMHVDNYLEASMTPYIIEERSLNVAQMDVFFSFDDGSNHFFGNRSKRSNG